MAKQDIQEPIPVNNKEEDMWKGIERHVEPRRDETPAEPGGEIVQFEDFSSREKSPSLRTKITNKFKDLVSCCSDTIPVKENVTSVQPSEISPEIAQPSQSVTPTDQLIKGNADSKIYHIPGGLYYDKLNTNINFTAEAEAQAAGYRKSLR